MYTYGFVTLGATPVALLEGGGIVADVGVNANAIAGGAAEEFVNGNAEQFAFDVPEGLFDAAERAGEDGAAAIERVAIDGLPMVDNVARIFADQVGFDFGHGGGARFGAAFGDGFAQADDAFVGVNLEKEPARFHQERFEFGDAQFGFEIGRLAFGAFDGRRVGIGAFGGDGRAAQGRGPEDLLQKLAPKKAAPGKG